MNHTKAWKNFQSSIENSTVLIQRCNEYKTEKGSTCVQTQEILKRSSIILLMTSWETYIEDVCSEIFNNQYQVLHGSTIGLYVRRKFEDQLKKFHNPNSAKVAQLFTEFFNFDITTEWYWNSYNEPNQVKKKLNQWLEKRGEIAHRSSPDDVPSKPDIEKGIRFIRELVDKTDEIIQNKILNI